jgi:predicted dinucleotide-binding enzyme
VARDDQPFHTPDRNPGEAGRRPASGFAGRGHSVLLGTRDPDKPELRERLSGEGGGVEAGTFAQTAAHGGLLVLAVLGTAAGQAIADAGPDNFDGKVVIDATNPLDLSGGVPPKLSISGEDSLGERIQRALPDAKIVKAFRDAKRTVGDVLADFGRPDPVDLGGIEGSRELEAIGIASVEIGGARGAWDHGFRLLVG